MNTFRVLIYLTAATILLSNAKAQSSTTNPPYFQGYYLEKTHPPESITCPTTQTFLTSGAYATCCDTTAIACVPGTACLNNAVQKPGGIPSNCGTMETCFIMTVFPGSTMGDFSVLNFDCGTNWSAFTVFQELATTTTSSSSSGITISSAAPTTSTSSTSSTSSNLTPTSSPTPTPSQTAVPAHSSSKDWIAGAVIGPIAAAVSLTFLGYWIGRRRSKAAAEQAQTYPAGSKPPGEWSSRHELGSEGRQSIVPGMQEA